MNRDLQSAIRTKPILRAKQSGSTPRRIQLRSVFSASYSVIYSVFCYDNCCNFNQIKLLYVGTLYNRNIIETVKGINLFVKKYPDVPITYDIIGSGFENEIEELNDYIKNNNLSTICRAHGRIPYTELKPFFDKCNIGVSYIPITDYYQYQPPTKTYEYALSGMAVIATKTISNESVVNEKNGILINDNPEAFMSALEKLLIKKREFNSRVIIESVEDYRWEKIVEKYFVPIIEG